MGFFRPVLNTLTDRYRVAGGVPYKDDLDGWYKPISGNDFLESINDNNALFLPRVCVYNGSTAYSDIVDNGALDVNQAATDFCIGGYVKTSADITTIQAAAGKVEFASRVGRYGVYISAGSLDCHFQTSGGSVIIPDNIVLAINTEYYTFIRIDLTGKRIYYYIDSVLQNAGGTAYTGDWALNPNDFTFGKQASGAVRYLNGQLRDWRIYHKDVSALQSELMDGDELGDEVLMVPNNDPSWAYDVSANAYHLQSYNVTTDYEDTEYYYPSTNGYSLWQHATSDDIQVPFDLTGSPIALTAGVDIPAGYTKTRDIIGSPTKWNMADCLIDFDPLVTTAAVLDIFDRSNAVIQNVTSRASLYYDAGNPYRYHILEITTPNVYTEFFNVGYKGRIFAKIQTVLNGNNYEITRYDEQLNYATDKTGDQEFSVMEYCNIDILALIAARKDPIADEDDYVIIT